MVAETQLTRRKAIAIGTVCLAGGVPPVLGSIGVIPMKLDPGVPPWMGVAAGSVFLLAAALLFVDAAAGGANADGTLSVSAPAPLRALQTITGLGIVVLMGVMTTWIAFGRGERHFSTTISLPFLAYQPKNSDLPGRVGFGIGALLIWAIVIGGTVAALKRHLARLRAAQ
jgi:hypothetical protein